MATLTPAQYCINKPLIAVYRSNDPKREGHACTTLAFKNAGSTWALTSQAKRELPVVTHQQKDHCPSNRKYLPDI